MLLVVGTVCLPPENLDDARPVMARMISASRAEDGCEEYAYAEDILDAGLIHVKELWRDRAALDPRVPSIWLESTTSRRTHMKTNRSGFSRVSVEPPNLPTERSALESRFHISSSSAIGGSGGKGFGMSAR